MTNTAVDKATTYNESLYEDMWARMPFMGPDGMPWFPVLKELADNAPMRMELGPGVFPRLPVEGTHVCDLSNVALDVLAKHGAIVHRGFLQDLKLPDASYDLVAMFEVLEHVPDDEGLLREIARITKPGGRLVLTVPMGMKHYCSFDRYMGHVRRFEPDELRSKIERAGYVLERFEVHKQSVHEPAASFYVWVMKNIPWLMVWSMRWIFIPILRMTRIHWYDASEYDARMKGATDGGAVFRRV
ncbi:MAG TPA: methyltransferase domain-containing protein [Polyangiaceae bacterium]|jgi:SAM-dependent methyltransferase|nr:methyltransferase domain-containing protein [Polyangiaceae bacterium]